jgi:thiol:disulfide interchange protein DsbD
MSSPKHFAARALGSSGVARFVVCLFAALLVSLPSLASAAAPANDAFTKALSKGPAFAALSAFVGGLLVCLTPCVYPMVVITVSVFGAREAKTKLEAAALSTMFVLGIAATFTPLGVIAGVTGSAFGTALASKWVVIFISIVFLALAASMFGAFEMALPDALTQRLASVGGVGYGGAFALGMVSGLVAAPCTGPVLTGILIWIGETQSLWLGAGAMFAFSLGLGVPFWLVGTFAMKLPKSGAWMVSVKSVFGILMVVAALYFLRIPFPILTAAVKPTVTFAVICGALALFGVAVGAIHLAFGDGGFAIKARKSVGIVSTVVGVFALVAWLQIPRGQLSWLHSEDEARTSASTAHKPLLVDFTATWCGACQELAKHTFADSRVQAEASRFVAVKVDATNDEDPKVADIMKRYAVKGLPTVVVLDSTGKEAKRFVDFVPADEFYDAIRGID